VAMAVADMQFADNEIWWFDFVHGVRRKFILWMARYRSSEIVFLATDESSQSQDGDQRSPFADLYFGVRVLVRC
jgi:hypothetical protein